MKTLHKTALLLAALGLSGLLHAAELRLRLMETHNIEAWQRENKSVERVALAAFSVLNHHESPECHFELKQALMAMGFCPRCEWRPCECEGQYDD